MCRQCHGTGSYKYTFEYTLFQKKKKRDTVERVYLSGYGYKIGLGTIGFDDGKVPVGRDKGGVSCEEFMEGKMPGHIRQLACPLAADQGMCHSVKGFVDRCNKVNGGWLSCIPDCKGQYTKHLCWEEFDRMKAEQE